LVACNSYSLKGNNRIRVHSPQIINGCQTVSSLHRAYLQLDEDERADFDAHVRVQVKLLQHPDPELLDQIVISTNNQNPMKPRNLRSNTVEQKAIQRSFRSLASPWFFVRKDGEFDALCGSPRANWFRRGHYQTAHGTGSARYRTLDNVLVAKDWYSWIGAAPVVLRGGNDFFGDEMLYRRVFALRPSPKHWDYFRSEEFRAIDEDLLEVGPPSASEYLLASCVAAFIRASGLSPYRNKKASLMRGVAMGALSGNLEIGHVTSSTAQQAAFLASDMEYLLNNYLNNIEDVLVELASATIASRFEGQGESVSTELLAREDVAAWCDSAFGIPFAQVAVEYPRGLLHDLATTVRTAAAAYCREHADEVSAASRPKMFLGRRETILEMRSYL
ncbi:MAG: AIPR family protein, partial [Coriobacteriia bacterium]|nr:AIPR family protein [Coriobacteriia bacterium]